MLLPQKNLTTIYTDGSCLKNPDGPGGWGGIIIDADGDEFHISGNSPVTTNNRMEMTAVIETLRLVKPKKHYKIITDSMLVINCATGKWKRNANNDLWEEYDKVSKDKYISFEWVKGHNGNHYNEMVDKMALSEARSIP